LPSALGEVGQAAVEAGDLEQPQHLLRGGRLQPQSIAVRTAPIRGGDERRDAGRVDELEPLEVDDDLLGVSLLG
jgi:hypothetical protein